jgi:putative peptidoglycan lipid II flippase
MQRRSLAQAAALVGAAYVLSNLAGFVQRVIVASRFGTGQELDAFNAALRVPDLLFNVLAGGALASAFIPIFTGHLTNNQQPLAWALARRVAVIVFAVMSAIALVAIVLAEPITRVLIAPGFSDAQVALTASLMRIMLVSTVIFGVSGLLMGVLQSNGAFLAPAIAPALYNLGIILGAVLLSNLGIFGPAIGVVIGALLHLSVQVPTLRQLVIGKWVTTEAQAQSPITNYQLRSDARQILLLMLPRVIGLAAVQINLIVNTRLASRMDAGAVSALNIAFAIMILPQAAIAQAIGTVLFPAISANAARGERAAFGAAITRALSVIIALSMPATVGLIVLGQPLIRLLFERGEFTAQSTAQVSFALQMFAVGLVAHSVLEVVTRGFYALKDTARPVALAVASMALNIALSVALADAFARAGWMPFGGVALANAIATTLETVALYWILARREPGIATRTIVLALGKAAVASVAMGLVLVAWLAVMGSGAFATVAALVIGGLVYFAAAFALRSDEARFATQLIKRRVSPSPHGPTEGHSPSPGGRGS